MLARRVLLALCLSGAVVLVGGCADEHTDSLDGGTVGDYPMSTVEGDTTIYHFSNILGIEDHVRVECDGEADAVRALDGNIRLEIRGNYIPEIKAISHKENAFGVWVANGWQFEADHGVKIYAKSERQSAYGVDVTNYGEASFEGDNTSIEVYGRKDAYGIIAEHGGFVCLDGHNISVRATAEHDAYGIAANASKILFGGDNVNIEAASAGENGVAKGIVLMQGGKAVFEGSVAIQAMANGSAYGVDAVGNETAVGFNDIASVSASSSGASGQAYGVYAADGARVHFNGAADISAVKNGAPAVALWSENGDITFAGLTKVRGNVYAVDGGNILFADTVTIMGDILADNGGNIELKAAAHSIQGDLAATHGGKIKLSLIDGGVLRGSMGVLDGTIDLNLRGAIWDNTGKSKITSINAAKGVINQNTAEELYIGLYDGNAQVNYKNSNETIQGGKVIIDRAQEGSRITLHTDSWGNSATFVEGLTQLAKKLQYNATDATDATRSDGHLTAQASISEGLTTPSVTAAISLYPKNSAGNDIGVVYMPGEGRLVAQVATLLNDSPIAINDGEDAFAFRLDDIVIGAETTQTMRGIKGAAAADLLAWRAENGAVHLHLEELRNTPGTEGLWAKLYGGESIYDRETYFKNQYQSYQIGYDKRFAASENDVWLIGGAVGYTDGSSDFLIGSGENSLTNLFLYGSWLGGKGHFFDFSVQKSWLHSDYTVYSDTLGLRTDGDYSHWGVGISAVYGKKIIGNNGWYFEPQVGLSYGHVDDADYTTGNAMRMHQDDMDSLIGSVGINVGKAVGDNGSVYLHAAALREFDGKTNLAFSPEGENAKTVGQDFGGNWGEIGLGGKVALSDHHYVYADVTKTIGGDVKTPWRWNAGVRVSF